MQPYAPLGAIRTNDDDERPKMKKQEQGYH